MKYFKIFLLYTQDSMTDRLRSLVWVLIPFINAAFFLLFWSAAFQQGVQTVQGWDRSMIMTYYLLLIIVGAMLLSHIELSVDTDIRLGEVSKYLLKPFPYYWFMFFTELPYRLIQGFYAILFYVALFFFFPEIRIPTPDLLSVLLILLIFICAYFLCFTYKMLIGLVTFWIKDNKGIRDTSDVLILFLAGFNFPLTFLPSPIAEIALSLPFSYIIYYPLISLLGELSAPEMMRVLFIQLIWLALFTCFYKFMLKGGLKKYTAVGQ
jgi:ABC-2 type transport system permease protein